MAGRSYSGRTNVGTTRRKSVGARYCNGGSQNDKRELHGLCPLCFGTKEKNRTPMTFPFTGHNRLTELEFGRSKYQVKNRAHPATSRGMDDLR